MDAQTQATQLYIQRGVAPDLAEQYAREYVAFLRLLVREARRQEQEEAAEAATANAPAMPYKS